MKPENKALALMTVAIAAVVIAGAVGIDFLPPAAYGPSNFPTSLPLLAGSLLHFWPLQPNQEGTFVVPFDVAYPSGRFMGRWYADHGGWLSICETNSTCLLLMPHVRYCDVPWNGSMDVTLVAGSYVMQFYGPRWDNITIEESMRVAYPGNGVGTTGLSTYSACPSG